MDNLTHTLTGVVLAKAGFSERFGRGTTLALAVASNLPDVDTLGGLFGGGPSILDRRMFTHSIFGIPLLAAAGAVLFHRFYRHISRRAFFGLFLLAMGIHVLLDLINSFGVVLFYPASMARFELAWVFIIDFAIWGALIIPLLLSAFPFAWAGRRRLCRVSLVLLGLYLAFSGGARTFAGSVLRDAAEQGGLRPEFAYVFPEPLGPHRFRGVLREGEEYRLFLIHVLSGECVERGTVRTDEKHPEVAAIREGEMPKRMEWFFLAPVWRVVPPPQGSGASPPETDGDAAGRPPVAEVYDLRFRSLVLEGLRAPFTYRFRRTPEGIQGPYRSP